MPIKTMIVGDSLLDMRSPLVMGILNVTKDSFYDGGQYLLMDKALQKVQEMVDEGVDIVDVGAFSSRPGAVLMSAKDQLTKLKPIVSEIVNSFPKLILSIDCFHGEVVDELSKLAAFIGVSRQQCNQKPLMMMSFLRYWTFLGQRPIT